MPAKIIDGKAVAEEIKKEIAAEVEALKARGVTPGIATLLVGDDYGSMMYRGMVEKNCAEVGFGYVNCNPPADATEEQVVGEVRKLNSDGAVSGILPLRPFPKQISDSAIINSISLDKDIDCFHPMSMGRLTMGEPALPPATPAACIELLERSGVELAGKRVVVVGRSNILGKPAALMSLARNATVTIAHSYTSKSGKMEEVLREADVIIAAVGVARMIKKDMVRPGVVIIDAGINREKVLDENGQQVLNDKGKPKSRTVGDVDYEAVSEVAAMITPVPGGVGSVTNMMLMKNALVACKRLHGI